MISIATADLLTAWERALSQSSASRRLLMLLATAYPELAEEQLLKAPIGQRDGLALQLREVLFGSQLISVAICPFCTEQLELTLNASDIQVASNSFLQKPLQLQLEGFKLEFRLPDSQDLMHIETINSIEEAHNILMRRCLLSVSHNDQACDMSQLPETVLQKIEAVMSEADPQADVQLDLHCPACQRNWLATFDIASFLWSEINTWAQRLLNEVHLLAKAYCWRETDILAMSSMRRRMYLERLTQ